ncbi:MAG TPA: NCS2 family permease [bacterium]|jgi:AGZA family xanthine/uracil permease-like MFS transporter|nr:NCS2 family permease [bacterium]
MRLAWFYPGDLDGFFGLFVDNLLQLLLIQGLCTQVCGMPADFVATRVLPGAAFSVLLGNAFYAWQAKRLAERESRPDTTALPYGINTVSLFAFVFLVMGPVYRETHDPMIAWEAGLFACLGSALIELCGAFVGGWLRRNTPRAALLSALAGIALTFISMGFVFQIFASPILAVLPAFLILLVYSSRIRLPWGLPGGFAAVLLGTALAWILRACGLDYFNPPALAFSPGLHLPRPAVMELWSLIFRRDGWRYLGIVLPMGLFNVVGSLQNLESAEAAGDRFDTRSSLLANGLGGLAAALLGSPFPTTIYIGHPGWKAMGARWGYSLLNGVVVAALCLTGSVATVMHFIPMQAMIGILLWIGVTIAASAYRDVPRSHFLGVAFGLVPALAAWLLLNIDTALRAAGTSLYQAGGKFPPDGLAIQGVYALNQGFILTSMIFAAMLVYAVERRWLRVAVWALAAAALSFFGVIHAWTLGPLGLESNLAWAAAPDFALSYLGVAALALGLNAVGRGRAGSAGA